MARRFKIAVLDVVRRRKMGFQGKKQLEKYSKPTKRDKNARRTDTHKTGNNKMSSGVTGSKSYQVTTSAHYLSPPGNGIAARKIGRGLDRQKSVSSPNLNANLFESNSDQK